MIVFAISTEEVLAIAQSIVTFTPELPLIWEVNIYFMIFLDLEIFTSSQDKSRLFYKPCRKLLNHFERITFSLANPLWMKKDAFVGKIAEIANLPSTWEIYENLLRDLHGIY